MGSPVHTRRLIELGRNLFERRQEHEHGRPELPDRKRNERPDGRSRRPQPREVRLYAEHTQYSVDDAILREHAAPQHRHGHRTTKDRRHIECHPEETGQWRRAVEQHGDRKRKRQPERHRDACKHDGHAKRLPEQRIRREHRHVIAQPHPYRRSDNAVIGERIIQRKHHGNEQEHYESDDERQCAHHTRR